MFRPHFPNCGSPDWSRCRGYRSHQNPSRTSALIVPPRTLPAASAVKVPSPFPSSVVIVFPSAATWSALGLGVKRPAVINGALSATGESSVSACLRAVPGKDDKVAAAAAVIFD